MPSTLFITLFLFGLTLLAVAPGFRRLVHFVSVGYAFAITTMALATMILFRQHIGGHRERASARARLRRGRRAEDQHRPGRGLERRQLTRRPVG